MSNYAFILGRNAQLSIAELRATLPTPPHYADGLFALAETTLSNPQKFLDTLGGTLKIFEIRQTCVSLEAAQTALESFLQERFANQTHKLSWGLSVFGLSQGKLKTILMDTKKSLRQAEISARFVNKDFQNLNSATTIREKLWQRPNTELAIFCARNTYLLGELCAVQNINAYSVRDFDRPARSAKAGMFPPKLAQILLNLAQVKNCVYDPFCGSGTVLTEALTRGFTVFGSDLSPEQVADSEKNCAWLSQKFGTKLPDKIFVQDATAELPEIKCDAIVTEGFLGTPLMRPLDPKKAPAHLAPIEKIYEKFLSQVVKILPQGARLAITFPFFRGGKTEIFLNAKLLTHAQSCGLEIVTDHIAKPDPKRPSVFYYREDQFVGREIWVFVKK